MKQESVLPKLKQYNIFIGLIFVFLYFIPYLILGENAYVSPRDNLECRTVYFTILARSGLIFNADSLIPNVMNGIPRVCFPNPLNIIVMLFYFFKPFIAYVINEFFVRFVAFFGMYFLLKEFFIKNIKNIIIVLLTSVYFSYINMSVISGLYLAGQPLILYAFLCLRENRFKFYHLLIILLFPFCTELVFSFPIILTICLVFFYDWFIKKNLNKIFLLGLVVMCLGCVLAEYNLINTTFFNKGFVSHREDWNIIAWAQNYNEVLKTIFYKFTENKVIIGFTSLYFLTIITENIYRKGLSFKKYVFRKNDKIIVMLILICFFISIFYGFYLSDLIAPLRQKVNILKTFQFNRIYYLNNMFWYVIFALILVNIKKLKFGRYFVILILVLQFCFVLKNNGYTRLILGKFVNSIVNVTHTSNLLPTRIYKSIQNATITQVTYKQFYSEELFKEIKEFIARPQESYRTVNIGFHPAVSQYNGFYTLDSYQVIYPLEYKRKFRRVIEKELKKSDNFRKYFDYWGNRCYVFSAEQENIIIKSEEKKISNLELNIEALKELGAEYVFSAVDIENFKENDLELLRKFEYTNSFYTIYLYKIK